MKAMRAVAACAVIGLWSGIAAADMPPGESDEGCECGVAGVGGQVGAGLGALVAAAAALTLRRRRSRAR